MYNGCGLEHSSWGCPDLRLNNYPASSYLEQFQIEIAGKVNECHGWVYDCGTMSCIIDKNDTLNLAPDHTKIGDR
jgi:hypothetical protein